MAWFRRLKRRLKNLTSDGDYAGSHSGSGDTARSERNAKAQFETYANRPDRFGSGGGSWG